MLLTRVATNGTCVLLSNTTDDERRLLRAAVLGTQKQRLIHIVTAFLEGDSDATLAARVVGAAPLTGLSQGVMQALAFAYDYFAAKSIAGHQYKDDG